MGANMARHLQLDCGHDVTAVYDINKEAAGELATELNAANSEKLADVTASAEVRTTPATPRDTRFSDSGTSARPPRYTPVMVP